jgi:hypothetical protein
MVLADQVILSVVTRVDDVLTNNFISPYQKLDCVFHDRGFVIHWSSKNVTANLVGFLETIILSTKNGYEDLTIGPIHPSRGIERHKKSIPHKIACMAIYSFKNHNTINEN